MANESLEVIVAVIDIAWLIAVVFLMINLFSWVFSLLKKDDTAQQANNNHAEGQRQATAGAPPPDEPPRTPAAAGAPPDPPPEDEHPHHAEFVARLTRLTAIIAPMATEINNAYTQLDAARTAARNTAPRQTAVTATQAHMQNFETGLNSMNSESRHLIAMVDSSFTRTQRHVIRSILEDIRMTIKNTSDSLEEAEEKAQIAFDHPANVSADTGISRARVCIATARNGAHFGRIVHEFTTLTAEAATP